LTMVRSSAVTCTISKQPDVVGIVGRSGSAPRRRPPTGSPTGTRFTGAASCFADPVKSTECRPAHHHPNRDRQRPCPIPSSSSTSVKVASPCGRAATGAAGPALGVLEDLAGHRRVTSRADPLARVATPSAPARRAATCASRSPRSTSGRRTFAVSSAITSSTTSPSRVSRTGGIITPSSTMSRRARDASGCRAADVGHVRDDRAVAEHPLTVPAVDRADRGDVGQVRSTTNGSLCNDTSPVPEVRAVPPAPPGRSGRATRGGSADARPARPASGPA